MTKMTKLNRSVKTASADRDANHPRVREKAKTRARELESEVAARRLVAQATDRIDGMLAVMDLATMCLRGVAARRAGTMPPPFVPASRLLTEYKRTLFVHVRAIGDRLHGSEVDRLACLAPGFMSSLNAEDADVVSAVVTLLQAPPDIVALWLRANLDAVERRFAS